MGSILVRPAIRWATATVFLLAMAMVTLGVPAAGAAGAAVPGPQPNSAAAHAVAAAAQQATRAFWTSSRMEAATQVRAAQATSSAGPPPGIPSPTHFDGVPTVGALFFTTGSEQHFCTASVVNSVTANLILTAAHCVYSNTYAKNIEFVPQYHDGKQPYGAWPVQTITVAAGWRTSNDPNLDFAFLQVSPPPGTHLPIQHVTGGLRLGIDLGYHHRVEVIGYNNTEDAPITCATHSFKFEPDQMKFFCNDYQDGTSGGPWIVGDHGGHGTGTVIGVIGGFEQGGDFPWASYSAYFGWPTLQLFWQAEAQQA